VAVAVVCAVASFHKYEYGAVPPDTVTIASPSFPSKQDTFTTLANAIVASKTKGSVTVTFVVVVQLLASVTVTVYVPASNPVAVAVVCAVASFHKYEYGAVPPDTVTVASPSFPSK